MISRQSNHLLLVLISLVLLSILGGVLMSTQRASSNCEQAASAPVEVVRIPVARYALHTGQRLEKDMIEIKEVPTTDRAALEALINPFIAEHDVEIYVGGPLGQDVRAGEPLNSRMFFGLPNKLTQEERAYTLKASELRGLYPGTRVGDRVDLMWSIDTTSLKLPEHSLYKSKGTTSMNFLDKVNVIDVHQKDSEITAITLALTPQDINIIAALQPHAVLHVSTRHKNSVEVTSFDVRYPEGVLEDMEVYRAIRKRRKTSRPVLRKSSPIEVIKDSVK